MLSKHYQIAVYVGNRKKRAKVIITHLLKMGA
jgi:ribosomal protein L21E